MHAHIHVYVYECMHVRTNTCASAGTRERRARLHLLRDLFRRDIRLQVANNGVERVRCDEGNDQAAAFRDEAEHHGDAEEGELRAGELLVPPGSQLAFGREGRVTVGGARGQLGQRGGAAVSVSSPPNAWGTPAPRDAHAPWRHGRRWRTRRTWISFPSGGAGGTSFSSPSPFLSAPSRSAAAGASSTMSFRSWHKLAAAGLMHAFFCFFCPRTAADPRV